MISVWIGSFLGWCIVELSVVLFVGSCRYVVLSRADADICTMARHRVRWEFLCQDAMDQ